MKESTKDFLLRKLKEPSTIRGLLNFVSAISESIMVGVILIIPMVIGAYDTGRKE